jgi:hypothetical protein
MSKSVKALSIIALVIVILAAGIYIFKNVLNSSTRPQNSSFGNQTASPSNNNSNSPIGALNIAVAPEGIGTPGWEPSANYRPEYKNVFSPGAQVMLDFAQVTKPMNVEVKMYDKNDQAADFSAQFSLKTGNDGNCCFGLPTQTGKYTVKVSDTNGVVLTRNLEIK